MINDSNAFLIPHRQHLQWYWHLLSQLGLPCCCGELVPRGFFLLKGGCASGAKWRQETPDHLSVHQKAPHSYFHSIRRLNVQCRHNALGREGLGPVLWPRRPNSSQPLTWPLYIRVGMFSSFSFLYFIFFFSLWGYNSIKQFIWIVGWCSVQFIHQREICFPSAGQFDKIKASSTQALDTANCCENKIMRGRLCVR